MNKMIRIILYDERDCICEIFELDPSLTKEGKFGAVTQNIMQRAVEHALSGLNVKIEGVNKQPSNEKSPQFLCCSSCRNNLPIEEFKMTQLVKISSYCKTCRKHFLEHGIFT